MGLDLTLYAVPATDDIDINKIDEWVELAYGRKTWFIWDYFKNLDNTTIVRDNQILTIPKEAWKSFIEILDRNRERISDYVSIKEEEEADYISLTKEFLIKAQIKETLFQQWYDDTFDTTPTLGYEWDARAMLRWLEVDSEVRKYLNDPSYILLLEASY